MACDAAAAAPDLQEVAGLGGGAAVLFRVMGLARNASRDDVPHSITAVETASEQALAMPLFLEGSISPSSSCQGGSALQQGCCPGHLAHPTASCALSLFHHLPLLPCPFRLSANSFWRHSLLRCTCCPSGYAPLGCLPRVAQTLEPSFNPIASWSRRPGVGAGVAQSAWGRAAGVMHASILACLMHT